MDTPGKRLPSQIFTCLLVRVCPSFKKPFEKNKAEIKENYKALNKCRASLEFLFINKWLFWIINANQTRLNGPNPLGVRGRLSHSEWKEHLHSWLSPAEHFVFLQRCWLSHWGSFSIAPDGAGNKQNPNTHRTAARAKTTTSTTALTMCVTCCSVFFKPDLILLHESPMVGIRCHLQKGG